MSRIGSNEILIPEGVTVKQNQDIVFVSGKIGELQQQISNLITVKILEKTIKLNRINDEKETKSLHGLYGALISNMLKGVSEGFTKKLEFIGVGYRVAVQGSLVDISAGYSHNIVFQLPKEVKGVAETEKGKAPILTLSSHDKQLLGAVAAKIRSFRKPEPYKGKGIRYKDEYVRRKAGKTAAATAS
ncbi:MAG: 50S ribosomal protein L6 [Bacteroidota bacterium]|nr:50S ribosomal protein L6 [Bacteroidota bacterium]